MPQKIALVYGALRSGTTLLRLMLDGHPALRCPGESDFLVDHLARDGTGWRYDRPALEAGRIFKASGLRYPAGADGVEAFGGFVAQIRGDAEWPVLMLHRGMERLVALAPHTRVIHLKRDPRDVARSSIGMGWAGNVWHGASHWMATEDSWQAGSPGLTHRPLEVFYERLIAAPEAELSRICAYLDVPYDPEMLRYPERSSYAAPDPGLTSQWKRKLSPQEIGLIEARLGDRLAAHGYVPSGHPPAQPGPLELARLVVQNRAATLRFAARRHGWPTVLQHRLAGRAGLRGLRAAAQARIDANDIRHLK